MANYQDRVTTLRDILQMSPEERKATYRVDSGDKHIDKVTINGNVFTDYSAFSFLWEKSYVKSPVRSGDGTIGNLNSYATFLTPHLKIDFSLMSIVSYRKIMELIYSGNEFLVTCYDVVNDKDTTNKMYFSTEEMPKLWTIVDALNGDENAIMLLGVQDYTIEMIGTNSKTDNVTINYYLNAPIGNEITTPIGSFDTAIGGEIILGVDSNIGSYENYFEGYAFNGWRRIHPKGLLYSKNFSFPIQDWAIDTNSNSINFYADWVQTNVYTLNYNYGLGTPKVDTNTMQEITSKSIKFNETIGELPNSESVIYVEYGEENNKKKYPAYTWLGWFKTSIKGANSIPLNANTPYWIKGNSTIYQLYQTASFLVDFIVDGKRYSSVKVEYGTSIPMPQLIKNGYTFKGWEFTYDGKTQILTSFKMPPFAVTLTAVFEEIKQ
jgi:hypothetical protein